MDAWHARTLVRCEDQPRNVGDNYVVAPLKGCAIHIEEAGVGEN